MKNALAVIIEIQGHGSVVARVETDHAFLAEWEIQRVKEYYIKHYAMPAKLISVSPSLPCLEFPAEEIIRR